MPISDDRIQRNTVVRGAGRDNHSKPTKLDQRPAQENRYRVALTSGALGNGPVPTPCRPRLSRNHTCRYPNLSTSPEHLAAGEDVKAEVTS